MASAPSAQFSPNRDRVGMGQPEYQKAVGVWPDSVRPDRSVIVPEIITGRWMPFSRKNLVTGENRRLGVERVEDGLDQDQIGAAIDQPAQLLAIGFAQAVEGDGAVARIV